MTTHEDTPLDLDAFEGHTPGPWRFAPEGSTDTRWKNADSTTCNHVFGPPGADGCTDSLMADECYYPSAPKVEDMKLCAAAPALLALARGQRDEIATRDGAHKAYRATAEKVEATLFSTIDDKDDEIAELEKDKARLHKAWMSATQQALENGGAAHKLAADLAEAREVLQEVHAYLDSSLKHSGDASAVADELGDKDSVSALRSRVAALLPRGDGEPTHSVERIKELRRANGWAERGDPGSPGIELFYCTHCGASDAFSYEACSRPSCFGTFKPPVVADSEQGGATVDCNPIKRSERDWDEDFGHENGDYCLKCITCKEQFRGHKRRTSCRACQQGGE